MKWFRAKISRMMYVVNEIDAELERTYVAIAEILSSVLVMLDLLNAYSPSPVSHVHHLVLPQETLLVCLSNLTRRPGLDFWLC